MDEEDEHFLSASHRKCTLLSGTECHIISYLLTELARAVPGNIGPRSFSYRPRCARSVLSRPRANIPQYGPSARLVRGYYSPFVTNKLSFAVAMPWVVWLKSFCKEGFRFQESQCIYLGQTKPRNMIFVSRPFTAFAHALSWTQNETILSF